MSRLQVFTPVGDTTGVAATTSSSSTDVSTGAAKGVRISNSGSVAVHVVVGIGTQTATTSSLAVLAGESVVLSAPFSSTDTTEVGIRTASSTATVYVTPVEFA